MKPYFEQDGIVVYHADCRDVLPTVGRFDLCLTDPPYGVMGEEDHGSAASRRFGRNADAGIVEWDKAIGGFECSQMQAVSGVQMIWGGNHFPLGTTSGWLVWDKMNDGLNFGEAEWCWTSMKFAPRIYRERCVNIDGDRIHPTQKPVGLMLWCISKARNPQSVIDPFLGSGTTLVACKKLGIRGVGIEREEKYCEMAVKRILGTTPSLFGTT